MARYRKIETSLWGDRRFRELSSPPPNGKSLWLYLLCGPRTTQLPGVVVAREAVMADDLGWPLEGFREAFEEASAKGMAKADWDAGVVVLPKALLDSSGEPRDTSRPESPNVLKSWAKAWGEVPDCALKDEYLHSLKAFAEALGEGFAKAYRQAFAKALAHPSPNQEQDQEQEQERDTQRARERHPKAGVVARSTWNHGAKLAAELKASGIQVPPWALMVDGDHPAWKALLDRACELLVEHTPEQAEQICRNRVDVAAAKVRAEPAEARWFACTAMFSRSSFEAFAYLSPEQFARRSARHAPDDAIATALRIAREEA